MGKQKKAKKQRTAGKPYSKEDTMCSVAEDADMDTSDAATKEDAMTLQQDTSTPETIGKIKQRHHEEWKKIRAEISLLAKQKCNPQFQLCLTEPGLDGN